ncbi:MAG: FecR domain-containing protein [Mariprofundales bacterium]|nr:FecR domain-containing protein [Mariprofundales bacterium]
MDLLRTTTRNMPRIALLLLLLGIALVSALAPSTTMAATAGDRAGEVALSMGDAKLFHNGVEQAIQRHMPLYAGDTLLTGAKGRIKCKMVDQSVIYVSKNTRIIIKSYTHDHETLKNGSIHMLWGKGRFLVHKLATNGAFDVKTSTAVLGVRGTEFAVLVPPPTMLPTGPNVSLKSIPPIATRMVLLHGVVVGTNIKSGVSRTVQHGVTADFHTDGTVQTKPSKRDDINAMPTPTASEKKASEKKKETVKKAAKKKAAAKSKSDKKESAKTETKKKASAKKEPAKTESKKKSSGKKSSPSTKENAAPSEQKPSGKETSQPAKSTKQSTASTSSSQSSGAIQPASTPAQAATAVATPSAEPANIVTPAALPQAVAPPIPQIQTTSVTQQITNSAAQQAIQTVTQTVIQQNRSTTSAVSIKPGFNVP